MDAKRILQNKLLLQYFRRCYSVNSLKILSSASTSKADRLGLIISKRSAGGGGSPHDWKPSEPKGSGTERGVHAHGYDDPTERTNVPQPVDYKPGTDSFDYENPWPKINKGRLDWLFDDGWRRPPAMDQGQFYRRNWAPMGWNVRDEHQDWFRYHFFHFIAGTLSLVLISFMAYVVKPDTPRYKAWCIREAYMEIERREAAGLPLVSPDLVDRKKVEAVLPSDEELGDFKIII